MTLPMWLNELSKRYSSGQAHAFLLHGNVADYVEQTADLESFLAAQLADRLMVVYDIARGFRFPFGPALRQAFLTRVGLAQEDAPANPALSALRTAGGVSAPQEAELPRSPSQALPLLESFLLALPAEDEPKAAAVVLHLEAIAPAAPLAQLSPAERETVIRLQQWGANLDGFTRSGAIVVGVTRALGDLHETVRSSAARWEALPVPIPNEADRLTFWQILARREGFQLEEGLTLDHLARVTAGLGRLHLEDIALRAVAVSEESPVTLDLVRARKADIISAEFADVIELAEPRWGWEGIGGKDRLKDWFKRNVVRSLRTGNTRRCPKGVLALGPAGTGKSVFAEALAFEAGVNFVRFNLARILGQYVGNSERNLEKALGMISALAPTIVFIDEIDQSFQRGASGDSGVSQRLFRRIMEFMADPSYRGRVVWLAASNRPDLIDAALKRPGRFDKAVPFLAPDAEEREAILKVMLTRYAIPCAANESLAEVAAATEGWTGAELESLVLKASELAEDRAWELGDETPVTLTARDLLDATRRIRASTAGIEYMTALALREINDLDLLPETMRQRALDEGTLDSQIEAYQERLPRRSRQL